MNKNTAKHSGIWRAQLLGWSLAVFGAGLAGCANLPSPVPETPSLVAGPPADIPAVPEQTEIALEPGTVVIANAPAGKIILAAGPGLLRKITWAGATRWAIMQPRKERWAGSLGIYFEGTPPGWEPHLGLSKIKFEEGQRYFDNASDARIWMRIRRLHYVHNNQGLVVGWRQVPAQGLLQVEVWQFYIDGEEPTNLPGAEDHLIEMQHAQLSAEANS